MKFLIALFSITSLLFAETSDEAQVEEVSIIEQPTFTNPVLPQTQLTGPIPLLPKPYRSSFLTVGLSFLAPGLGHVYLGDLKTAGSLFGTATASASLSGNQATYPYSNLMSYQNTWFYSVYASYRDVRINNSQAGYSYRMPTDSYSDLFKAPFQASVLKKPEVWGGLIGALALGSAVSTYAYYDEIEKNIDKNIELEQIQATCDLSSKDLFPLSAFSIGLGEEAFFRGYLQSFCAEHLNPTGAIIASSLVFGAAHIPKVMYYDAASNTLHFQEGSRPYLTYIVPFITSFGGYFGWLAHKNRSLKEGVALHAWYDFTLFLGQMLINHLEIPTAMTSKAEFAYSFEF